MKLGARLESFGLGFRAALAAAAKLKLAGVEIDAVNELSPKQLTATGRKDLLHSLRSHGLELAAVNCPLRHGLDTAIDLQPRLERIMAAMSLSFELGVRKAIVPAPKVVGDDDTKTATLRESLTALTAHGSRIGVMLALDVGLDDGVKLANLLGRYDASALGVNYNPANMLAHGHDPVANLSPVKDRIVHTHAHDVLVAGSTRGPTEVAIGRGDVEWMSYLGTLSAFEYTGWVVVETADADAAAIEEGVRFLRRLI